MGAAQAPLLLAHQPSDNESRAVVQPVQHLGKPRVATPWCGGQSRLSLLLDQMEMAQPLQLMRHQIGNAVEDPAGPGAFRPG